MAGGGGNWWWLVEATLVAGFYRWRYKLVKDIDDAEST